MEWVCDNCYSVMKVTKEGKNRRKVSCPTCGETWYIDNNDEYINDYSFTDEDEDYKRAMFCRGED